MACHAGWIGSPDHRSGILREPCTRFGAGFGVKDNKPYCAEKFYALLGLNPFFRPRRFFMTFIRSLSLFLAFLLSAALLLSCTPAADPDGQDAS